MVIATFAGGCQGILGIGDTELGEQVVNDADGGPGTVPNCGDDNVDSDEVCDDGNLEATFGDLVGTFTNEDRPTGRALGIAKSGNYVYLGGYEPDLTSINVSDPTTPTLGFDSPKVSDGHLAVRGTTLYLATSSAELISAYDVSDGSMRVALPSIGNPSVPYYNVGVNETHAFISDVGNDLHVVDTADVNDSSVVGIYEHSTSWSSSTAVQKIVANDRVVALAVRDGADGSDGIHLVDVDIPSVPTFASTIGERPFDIALIDSYLYVPRNDGVRTYDISNPEGAEVAANLVSIDAYSTTVTYDDQYLYVASDNGILVVEDLPGFCDSACGNSHVEWPEQCDDGNRTSGDGCSASCANE